MFKVLVVCALVALCSANPCLEGEATRIVGGKPIDIEDAPYQVSFQLRGSHICGASIISNKWVLTAAHCTYGQPIGSLTVRVGSSKHQSGGVINKVARIVQHENYDPVKTDYDFSLLEMQDVIQFNNAARPIALLEQGATPEDGSCCKVSGWGLTQNPNEPRDHLRAAYVPTYNQRSCNTAYYIFGGITDRMICAGYKAGGKDACQGDSGGPLVEGNKLIGVVSWGLGCAQKNFPGVYARVASARDWIRQNSGV